MKITDREYELTGTGIDSASQTVYEYLTKKGVEGREALKIRLNVENVLIGWLEHEREAGSFFLSCSSGMGAETVVLSCKGPGYNPFEAEEGGEGQWISSMRHILESTPVYRYVNNINYVRFSVKSGYRSKVAEVLLFLLAGILIGLIGTLFPVAIRESVCSKLLTPVYETYLAVFSLCGIPLIFLSLVTGILGVGDIHSFSRIGTGMILRFILSSVAVALIALLISYF